MYFADNHIIGNPLSQGEILYTSGETHLIIEDVSWWKNVRLMLGFTHILTRSGKVGTRKLLQDRRLLTEPRSTQPTTPKKIITNLARISFLSSRKFRCVSPAVYLGAIVSDCRGRPPCRPTIAQDSSMRANTGVRPYKDCVFPLGNSAETWSRARQPQFNQWILKAFPLLVHGHEIDKYAPMCYNPHIQAIRRKLKTTPILTISHDATRRKH